jgi:hypothetical protein
MTYLKDLLPSPSFLQILRSLQLRWQEGNRTRKHAGKRDPGKSLIVASVWEMINGTKKANLRQC